MKLNKALVLALAMSAVPAMAMQHEFTGGTHMNFKLADAGSATTYMFGAETGYNYALDEMIQIGGELGLAYVKDGDFAVELGVGPTFNFGGPIPDAMYVQILGRLNLNKTNFGVKAAFGKRFALASDITWNPELAFDMLFKDATTWSLDIKIVNLAVHF